MTSPVTGEVVARPRGAVDAYDALAHHTAAWLWSFRESGHTRAAYRRDVEDFAAWCAQREINPVDVRRADVDAYAANLANLPNPRTGRPLAPASLARRLAALSSWYGYLQDVDVITANPMLRVRRPRIDTQHTTTVGMTAVETIAVLRSAENDPVLGPVTATALAGFLVAIGARVSEICALDVADLGHDSGHRTVRLRMKGGKTRTRAVPLDLDVKLAAMTAGRTTGPLFRTVDGGRMDRHIVARFVRRAAIAAGIPTADRITPHSFRHAWATLAREAGATLEERQHALGHADPRTTQRYDRARASLDRDPSYLISGLISPDPSLLP
jgi:site-specific recombinase XerD